MRGRYNNAKPTQMMKKVTFFSIFFENVPHIAYFWQSVDPQTYPEPLLTLYQGIYIQKNQVNYSARMRKPMLGIPTC